jgi:RNA polymerase sigma-70 factor (ECF subfamily)
MAEKSDGDEEMLDRLRRGDHHALAIAFSRYQARLRRMVELRLDRRLQGRVSPSDVLQEAYIDALKRLPHLRADPDVPLFVWLRTVTVQRLIEVHRQHLGAKARDAGREVPLALAAGVGPGSERMAAALVDLTSPSEEAERAETIDKVHEALNGLDAIDREVLALRHLEELNNSEVAALLGIRPAAASKRHLRALERFRSALKGLKGAEGG